MWLSIMSTVRLVELIVAKLVKSCLHLFWFSRFITVFHTIQSTFSHPISLRSILLLSLCPNLCLGNFFLNGFKLNITRTSHFSLVCYLPAYHILFDLRGLIIVPDEHCALCNFLYSFPPGPNKSTKLCTSQSPALSHGSYTTQANDIVVVADPAESYVGAPVLALCVPARDCHNELDS